MVVRKSFSGMVLKLMREKEIIFEFNSQRGEYKGLSDNLLKWQFINTHTIQSLVVSNLLRKAIANT